MGFWPVVDNVLKNADIVLLVLDARMPELSRNKEIERKTEQLNKPLLLVFTKIDLMSEGPLSKLKKVHPEAFFVSGTRNIGIKELRLHLHILGRKMGFDEPRIGVVGYPNLGKSAIINALARRARTKVADAPGTTRGVQWVRTGSLRILDSPGVIPYEDKGSKLALLGSKHPDKFANPDKVALDIIRMFLSQDKKPLEERYKIKIEPLTSAQDVLLAIGQKRGFLKRGGEVDEVKTSISVLRDWQKGKLKA